MACSTHQTVQILAELFHPLEVSEGSGLSPFSGSRSASTRQGVLYFNKSVFSRILSLKLFRFIKLIIYSLAWLNSTYFLYFLRPEVAV